MTSFDSFPHDDDAVVCCLAQTVECLACKLEIEVDDFDSTCCSAAADINLCQTEGVLYIVADGVTRDSALLGTTTYSRNGVTCTMTSFDSFPHDDDAVVCCLAQTVECLACKLDIEVDDFDSTCCSASADMTLCQNEGVLYIAADGLTRDPALLGTTTYSRNELTCTMTSFDSFPHDDDTVVCCLAQTVECLACKLDIDVDDFDSTCCSASADINLCQNEGALYIVADALTSDRSLLGTTTYSRNGLTCTMTSFDSFPHDEPEPNPEYGQPCTETTATINGVPVCTIASNDGNSDPWVLFGDINDQISNFVASHFTNSATTSGLHRGDSVQVGTFSAGDIGQAGYSLDIGQFCSGGSCNDNFDLMIQFGTADVFSHSENGYRTTNGGFINNDHTAQGVVIGEHGMFGSQADHPNGYYATYCAYNGGCTANGNDFWSFSTHGEYPNGPSSIVCGMYFADAVSPWKECPSGDNGHRMRYYIRSSDLPVSSIG
jgi:hypothetical protein